MNWFERAQWSYFCEIHSYKRSHVYIVHYFGFSSFTFQFAADFTELYRLPHTTAQNFLSAGTFSIPNLKLEIVRKCATICARQLFNVLSNFGGSKALEKFPISQNMYLGLICRRQIDGHIFHKWYKDLLIMPWEKKYF